MAYDRRLRFDVRVDTDVSPQHMEVTTGSDGVVHFDGVGCAHLPRGGDLNVSWIASGGVFVPVKDATAGTGSYAAEAGTSSTRPRARSRRDDGRLILDFDFAYNPSCAYDAASACPLAPAGNTLTRSLPAGELNAAAGARRGSALQCPSPLRIFL